MSTNDTENTQHVITTQPAAVASSPPQTPKRKVSIANDPVSESRYNDNLAFEPCSKRKTSQVDHLDLHHNTIPIRKRSILVNGGGQSHGDAESIYSHQSHDNKTFEFKHKPVEPEFNSRTQGIEQSWIYTFCVKCRGEDNSPSWEPPMWQKFCPFPLCPTFRQFARLWSIIIIGMIAWMTLYVIVGETAGPGGQLFQLVVLVVASNFGGFLMSLTTLPRLIGMLATGILCQNLKLVDIGDELLGVTSYIRKFSLVIILIRAGLEMDPKAFKNVYITILKLGLVPWTLECVLCAVLSKYAFGMPWMWSFALGSIIAAVSPAVIVPCLFRLRTKGYGVAKGIPTLIVAISGIDDAASVAIFGILASILFGSEGFTQQVSQAPVCVFGGLLFGIVWGVLLKFIPESGDAYVIPIRTLMLFAGGVLAVFGSEHIDYEGAGPLAVVFAAFIGNYFWCKSGDWEVEDNPVGTAFEILWMFFEPALFGVTGASVKIDALDKDVVTQGVSILVVCAIIRICCTILIAIGDNLNLKEKIFVAFACMAKATVQAALGPVALKRISLSKDSTDQEKGYAALIQTMCVLSIVVTAPIGAIMISILGPRLLNKTKQLPPTEGWRRSHRPSLYDISIIDEKEEREDPELQEDLETVGNTNSNANKTVFTITK
ncbi:sodium/hydrogen exchanger 9B2 [Contarinia nasturtii]|uniref:sodium/hydrogen exchanger 9B2 n=1 Tax=Contarinia nasturtii TaxID=265458 RepID=UPI0012D3A1B3|nr:sodium/hydrogen exchanger 9B2 [Contarinia nasturtii]XP_031632103.1 sodium/hydrogen exchanger 9B2 [Contarinia nasturtii]XP_031632104.1 sodium/hydrogen exchanger 9B2 [Contarinia nasturtii]XP_031632105.1 sodium/hydrogen exchanger 9B2 [Contarinia nasturtii]